MTEEKQEKPRLLVVQQLPTQNIREYEDGEGNKFDLITTDEALTEILEKVREIHKSVA